MFGPRETMRSPPWHDNRYLVPTDDGGLKICGYATVGQDNSVETSA